MQLEPGLTLEKATAMARQSEIVKSHVKEQQATGHLGQTWKRSRALNPNSALKEDKIQQIPRARKKILDKIAAQGATTHTTGKGNVRQKGKYAGRSSRKIILQCVAEQKQFKR